MAVEALEECVPCLTEGYKGQYKRSDEGRVKGSSDFALHAGPDLSGIWVAYLPAPTSQQHLVGPLEKALRHAIRDWNKGRVFPTSSVGARTESLNINFGHVTTTRNGWGRYKEVTGISLETVTAVVAATPTKNRPPMVPCEPVDWQHQLPESGDP